MKEEERRTMDHRLVAKLDEFILIQSARSLYGRKGRGVGTRVTEIPGDRDEERTETREHYRARTFGRL